MFCQYCHAEISPSHTHCPVCKQAVKTAHDTCPNCGGELMPDAACCNSCGYHLLLKKVIKLHEGADTPPQTSIICPNCAKEIPLASHFCEYCGSDVQAVAPAKPSTNIPSDTTTAASTGVSDSPNIALGFNEATFNALIKALDEKGVVSINELQNQLIK